MKRTRGNVINDAWLAGLTYLETNMALRHAGFSALMSNEHGWDQYCRDRDLLASNIRVPEVRHD